MATKIVTKNSSTASAVPTASDLVQGELAVNVADKRLFTEDNGGAIVELGTNPSTIDINAGSIDGTAIGASSASTGAFTTLTASGAVGINTSSPNFSLQLDSNRADATFNADDVSTWADFKIQGDTASGNARGIYFDFDQDTGNDKGAGIVGISGDASGGVGSLGFITTSGNVSAERMRIDSSGNVGIGTSSPSGKTHSVAADAQVAVMAGGDVSDPLYPAFGFDGQIGSNGGRGAGMYLPSDNTLAWSTAGTERMLIDSSGDIRLTGTAPSAEDNISTINFFNTSSNTNLASITGKRTAGGTNYGSLIFNTTSSGTSTERMRIDSSGNVGIGGTPNSWSTVTNVLQMKDQTSLAEHAGTGYFSQNWYYDGGEKYIGNGYAIRQSSSSVDGSWTVANASNNTSGAGAGLTWSERMRIDSSGATLINTTSKTNVGTRLGVWAESGAVSIETRCKSNVSYFPLANYSAAGSYIGGINATTTATSLATSSDQRLKENIADADDAGSKIDAIQVRQYDWKADGSHQDYGMIAQELREIIPNVIHESPDEEKMLSVDYAGLVPMLIKEIQSLRNRVAQLEE